MVAALGVGKVAGIAQRAIANRLSGAAEFSPEVHLARAVNENLETLQNMELAQRIGPGLGELERFKGAAKRAGNVDVDTALGVAGEQVGRIPELNNGDREVLQAMIESPFTFGSLNLRWIIRTLLERDRAPETIPLFEKPDFLEPSSGPFSANSGGIGQEDFFARNPGAQMPAFNLQ